MRSITSPFLLTLALGALQAGEPSPVVPAPAPVELTSAAWLESQPKPAFRVGHTLPRLTRYGWSLPFDTRVELTEDWGYALEYGGYVGDLDALKDPNSNESRVLALAKSDPKRYPVAVICSRQLPGEEAPPETWTRDKDGKAINGQAKSMDGTTWSEGSGAIFSPEAPVTMWQLAGKYRADPLAELRQRGLPISIVLNGGEYGLGVIGFGKPLWELDPKVMAAIAEEPFKGDWAAYISQRKGRAEMAIAETVRKAVPDRTLYVYYTAGGGTMRNKYWGQYEWDFAWQHMRGVSDLPSNEIYYKHFNEGFTGRENLLTLALNAAAAEIAVGETLSYNWICAGWPRGDEKANCADLARWTGLLKCYYTAGMLGANVGYYDFPPDGFTAPFTPNQPPIWLQQKVVSSHVHALFSQYEELIRQGDLLPGPMMHAISTTEPAYEFPSGDETARVLVRKQRKKAEWLLSAWAADGADRTVSVSVPELGRVELNARVCGSVYRATLSKGQVTLVQLDPEGATYTTVATGKPLVKPVDLAMAKPPAKGQLLWLSADSGVTKDADGKVSAWKSQGPIALSLTQPDAAHQPQWTATAVAEKPALRGDGGKAWLGLQPTAEQANAFVGPLTVFVVFTSTQATGDNRVISAIATVPEAGDWIRGKGFKMTDGMAAMVKPDEPAVLAFDAELGAPLASLSIGCMHSGGYTGFTGDVAEVLIYQGALPPAMSQPIIQYLRARYQPIEP